MADLADLDLVAAAAAVRDRSVAPTELLEAVHRRMDVWEPQVRALIGDRLESAASIAEQRTAEVTSGKALGPLHGVPVIVKDLIDVAGELTTASSKILKDNVASADATVVTRLREAGAVIVAKSNTHEFAYGALTPPTRNPWDTTRMPGGSSGGSAAATATGMAFGSLGSDTAASIREPAALCGVVGHKPTYGRVPLRGVIPLSWSLDTVGPICRSVADAALMLSVIEGHDDHDPSTVVLRPRVDSPGRSFDGLRIGVASELMGPNAIGVDDVLQRTLSTMADAGAVIEEVSVGDPAELTAIVFVILAVEASTYHRGWMAERIEDYEPDVRRYLEMGASFSGVDYVDAQRARRAASDRVQELFHSHDLLFAPAQHVPAPLLTDEQVQFADGTTAPRDLTLMRPLAPFNLTGNCGLTIPVDMVDGLPVGIQLVGPAFGDHQILGYGQELHEHLGWQWKNPPLPTHPRRK